MQIPSVRTEGAETNEGTSISIKDPDTILSMIVLLHQPASRSQSWRTYLSSNAREQISKECMLNSISIIPSSQDEVTSSGRRHELGYYQLGERHSRSRQ